MAMNRRIIAIQMLPKAYDEIQKLKGEETWTRFIIQCVLVKLGDNSILQDELASLTKKEPKAKRLASGAEVTAPILHQGPLDGAATNGAGFASLMSNLKTETGCARSALRHVLSVSNVSPHPA